MLASRYLVFFEASYRYASSKNCVRLPGDAMASTGPVHGFAVSITKLAASCGYRGNSLHRALLRVRLAPCVAPHFQPARGLVARVALLSQYRQLAGSTYCVGVHSLG